MKTVVTILAFLLTAIPARSGTIRLVPGIELNPEGLTVSVANDGDQAAGDLRVSIEFLNQTSRGEVARELGPGGSISETFEIDLGGAELPGLYPATAVVSYRDPEGHEFSVLVARLLSVGDSVRGDINLEISSVELRGSATVPVVVTNRGPRPRQVELRLKVSPDMIVREPLFSFEIPPWGMRRLRFRLENVSARPGSVYPVYALAQYREGGRQHSWMAAAAATVGEASVSPPRILLVLAVLAAASALFWIFRRRRGKKRKPA